MTMRLFSKANVWAVLALSAADNTIPGETVSAISCKRGITSLYSNDKVLPIN